MDLDVAEAFFTRGVWRGVMVQRPSASDRGHVPPRGLRYEELGWSFLSKRQDGDFESKQK